MPRSRSNYTISRINRPGTRKRTRNHLFSTDNQPCRQNHSSVSINEDISFRDDVDDESGSGDSTYKRLKMSTTNIIRIENKQPILPFKLRPLNDLKNEDETGKRQNVSLDLEYGIVKLNTISELMNNFLLNHYKLADRLNCKIPNVEFVKKQHQGLCITAILRCRKCMISSDPIELFDKTTRTGKRGPVAGCLNMALPLACLKTKMGMKDIQFLLSTLSIQPPSSALLQKNLNKLSDLVIQVNEESMIVNQHTVKEINKLVKQNSEYVSVETDVSYNNRLQLGYEAGTQSFSPMVENVTTKKMTLSLENVNRLCSKKNNICTHRNCTKNYPDNRTMASSEGYMVEKNIDKINHQGILKVDAITSDACNQINRICRSRPGKPIRHFTCYVHKMRNFQKHIHYMQLSPSSNTHNLEKSQYMKQLALAFRKRVQKEIGRINNRCKRETEFVKSASLCIRNVIDCFHNNHSMCHILSTVCQAHRESFRPNFLPCGKYLQLCRTDLNKITAILSKDFSHDSLHQLYGLTTTNKSESMHNRLMTYITKRVTWSRNFGAMCHSAVHSDTFGTGQSTLLLAQRAGITFCVGGPMENHMIHVDRINKYCKAQQQTEMYKNKRYFRKLHLHNRKLLVNSMYSLPAASIETHNFAINPN